MIRHPNIVVGDFTYATAQKPPKDWAAHLAPYTYAGAPEKLWIGKFCQIAERVRIITASANHAMHGISTFPFAMYDRENLAEYAKELEARRDTFIGNDVWIGDGATILPGARLGSGVIVGAGAVVRGVVPDYGIVSGNPARVVKMRFSGADIGRILDLAWWDWSTDLIEKAATSLARSDIDALEALKARHLL